MLRPALSLFVPNRLPGHRNECESYSSVCPILPPVYFFDRRTDQPTNQPTHQPTNRPTRTRTNIKVKLYQLFTYLGRRSSLDYSGRSAGSWFDSVSYSSREGQEHLKENVLNVIKEKLVCEWGRRILVTLAHFLVKEEIPMACKMDLFLWIATNKRWNCSLTSRNRCLI